MWLRWAVRLSPALQPDTVQFLPKVVVAYRSARDFVLGTRAPGDSTAATTWLWPAQETGERVGRIQVAAAAMGVPVRVEVKGVGPIGVGGSIPLSPGSYQISASAAGYDSMQVTREVLSGVTIRTEDDRREAARRIFALGPVYVVITGGHAAAPWGPSDEARRAKSGRRSRGAARTAC